MLLNIVNERMHLHLLDKVAELVKVNEKLTKPHFVVFLIQASNRGSCDGLRRRGQALDNRASGV